MDELRKTYQKIIDSTGGGRYCPAHNDKNPSFSVSLSKDGQKILLHCFAGCDFYSITKALGIEQAQLSSLNSKHSVVQQKPRKLKAQITPEGVVSWFSKKWNHEVIEVERYAYKDLDGALRFSVLRANPKDFRPLNPTGELNLKGVQIIPYRLPELQEAISAEKLVFFVEGEKDCDKALSMGLTCTTLPGGANRQWEDHFRDYFIDADVVVIPDHDHPGFEYAKRIGNEISNVAKRTRLLTLDGLNEGQDLSDWFLIEGNDTSKLIDLVESKSKPIPSTKLQHETGIISLKASDVRVKPLDWLWPNVLAKGKIVMIAGNPSLGKSQVSLYIASIVSKGGEWPISGEITEKGSVLILSAEDGDDDTIVPRLIANSADLEKIYLIQAVTEMNKERSLNLEKDIDKLKKLCIKLGDVSLVVIDPISAYLGKIDSNKNTDVRATLAPLASLAEELNISVLCISHLNKAKNGDALSRVSGSIAFTALSRASFLVAKRNENPERKLMLPLKNNLSKETAGFAYTLEETEIGQGISISKVSWESEPVIADPDEILGMGSTSKNPKSERVVEFLETLLAHGETSQTYISEKAQEEGISRKQLENAKKKIGVLSRKKGYQGQWFWSLPNIESSKDPKGPKKKIGDLWDSLEKRRSLMLKEKQNFSPNFL